MADRPKLTGGCLCGAVRYVCESLPLFAVTCHCNFCQKAHGAPFTSVFGVPAGVLSYTGSPVMFERLGDSGQTVRQAFCGGCGSRLFSWPAAYDGLVNIMITSLDDPEIVAPTLAGYTSRQRSWALQSSIVHAFPEAIQAAAPATAAN